MTTTPAVKPIHIAAIALGNALEFYDFLTYTFFSVYIGRVFFPSENPAVSLILSLATFGAGFFTRPLGGYFLGRMGDRIGRRHAMIVSFMLMGVSIIGLALTPSYAAIGIAAPIFVVVFRLMQGFALGGEVGPSTAFMVEAAPPNRRGLFVSLQLSSQQLAVLAAGAVGVLLSNILSPEDLESYGWRIAMLLGALVVPVGLILRRTLPETLHAAAPQAAASSGRQVPVAVIVLSIALLTSGTIGTYVINFLSTYAISSLGMSPQTAFTATMITGISGIIFYLLGGELSDRFGRRRVMLLGGALRLAVILPAFYALKPGGDSGTFFFIAFLLTAIHTATSSPVLVWLSESVPVHVRSGSIAVLYAVAISVFGGSTQVIIASLIEWLKDPVAPAYYWMLASLIGFVAAIIIPETAPRALIAKRLGIESLGTGQG